MSKEKPTQKEKEKSDRRFDRITIPLNAAELAQVEAANEASGLGLPAATFCRILLMKATDPDSKKK